ncbi:hypothetical protein W1080910_069 [Cyanophage S-RIM12 isolate W1_08_0910]|uniref:Uncharacterized protein n=4 Tax=Brizovirus TaxID=2733098 RepID=A0A1D7SYP8_9CAUD|nr:hypothetical protein HOQ65_gp167 [Cyanophage S-RIM12 isolate RW_06_0310]YP_009779478.1 hypothetical protein HOQ66_gp167 [Cyanophage S-RIM12 isolate W1_08_0910]AOO15342.1 hypothetical protein Np150310_068 [Cyanophage S-RIM12_Np_15_0310]AOO15982.1 hypothetical protein RW040310_068 [Cyanophage S-RIM12_RW_04_0310]AOO18775.1 hypothetical protein W1120610_069 [Cyanophage S-RIM12_W1_12_0610]AOO19415.1 hypothetical protein WH070310_069 [Cyanophage S-RIM12_WH_07_0310]AOO16411.1 hypothetical protein
MRITQYLLSGIIAFVTITCYLIFLAERDTKMMNYYDSTTIQGAR